MTKVSKNRKRKLHMIIINIEGKLGESDIELRTTFIRSKSPVFHSLCIRYSKAIKLFSGLSRNVPCLIASVFVSREF